MIVLSIIRGGGERISRKPITSPLRLSLSFSFHFPPGYLAPLRVYHCFAPLLQRGSFLLEIAGISRSKRRVASPRLLRAHPSDGILFPEGETNLSGDDERGDGLVDGGVCDSRDREAYGSQLQELGRSLLAARRACRTLHDSFHRWVGEVERGELAGRESWANVSSRGGSIERGFIYRYAVNTLSDR